MKTLITLAPQDFDAILFDLDGVLTKTARIHKAAWNKLFDGFLEQYATKADQPFIPFDIHSDYAQSVDGKPCYEGVAAFLESRAINLPWGTVEDGREM
ncbi:hypothetical protein HSX10_12480 [Winogradskyella undariae]|nr:hypothetical protein [Winogradskyella undariae]